MPAAATTTRERIEQVVLDCFEDNFEPGPREVAETLVDEDVAAGEYEGCSTELELAYTEYQNAAAGVLGVAV